MATKKEFADFWTNVFSKTKQLLPKEKAQAAPRIELFSLNKDVTAVTNLKFMADMMNKDPLFIQYVRQTTNRIPEISIDNHATCFTLLLLLR